MRIINNKWWKNAVVSNDADIRNYPSLVPNFFSGIWYCGIWEDGDWDFKEHGFSHAYWISGVWKKHGEYCRFSPLTIKVSPKSHYGPKLTLSLNYAIYKQ